MLTADKWMFSPYNKDLPTTFREMRLNAQFFAASITVNKLSKFEMKGENSGLNVIGDDFASSSPCLE